MIAKAYLPKSLFGRVLLILVLPTVLIQAVMAYVFFDRHWDDVTRHMSNTLAGEIAFFVYQLEASSPEEQPRIVADFKRTSNIAVFFDPIESFKPRRATREFSDFQRRLRNIIADEFTVRRIYGGTTLEVRVLLPQYALRMETSVKRLESRTTDIFVLWMVGASAIFLLIAVLFLRNQIRPIRRLAEAADSFGRGVDIPDFRPSGATEVRKAARAFIIMRERIRRQLRTRTEMLAGISHDLRTPLTRMKLEIALLKDADIVKELNDDVQQMEHMIQEYLDFARGEGKEEAILSSLRELLDDVVGDYVRQRADVVLKDGEDCETAIRISAFRRMLHNIIDNGLRYGKRCDITLRRSNTYCEILIDDEGTGIPQELRNEVFKPFSRLEPSRNNKTGGVGLGLAIARDVARAHGGNISLDTSPAGGLRVTIRLPL